MLSNDKTKVDSPPLFPSLRYNHPTSEGLQFLYDLPRALYEEIAGHLYKDALKKIAIFRGLEDAFLTSVSLRMKIVMFTPKEVIFM